MKNHFLFLAVLFALGSTSLHAQLPSYLPTDGLVGYWPFNGNANDESGNGNHGVVNGAVLAEDRNGNANSAYSFNGSNSYIDIGSTNGLSSNLGLTMSVWLNWSGPNSWSHQYLYIIAPNPNGAITLGNDGTLAVNVLNCNCLSDVGVSTVINQNIWYHVGLTYDLATGTLKLYLDGELIQSNSESIFSYYSTNNPGDRFGNYHFNEYYFSGKLDEGTLYNRALTQEEITALYNGTTAISGCTNTTACNYNTSATQDDGSCTFPAQTYLNCAGTCINDADNDGTCDELETSALPSYLPSNGLVGYWPFNGNANDESGNGNHGTVNGATLTADRNGNANSAYSFDGIDDLINVGNPVQLGNNPNSYTQIVWARFSDFPLGVEGSYPIMSKRHVENGEDWATPLLRSTQLLWFFADDSYYGNGPIATSGMLEQNLWYYLAFVKDGNSYKIYVNGIQISEIIDSHVMDGSASNLIFGAQLAWPQFLKGLLDDITIYNRALTPAEITALYNGTTTGGGGGNGGTAGTPAPSVPQGIPYQAMIRDNNGVALVNTPVTVRFSLHQDAIDGAVEYQETHNLTTNAFGLVNTHFGSGTATQGTFANINWSNTSKFIQVEANTGAGYVDMGTQQMMSVPFALQSNKAAMINNAGLPVYPDNAAALAGGLVAGEMYRTATGDLKIVY